MLKKAAGLTRPTPARRDAPFRGQGRSERLQMVLSELARVRYSKMARMSPSLRATFSPSHPLARRDVPHTRARVFRFSPLCIQGSSQTVLHCAHRTSTVSSCAFCEHKGWSGCSPSFLLRPRVARPQGTHRAIPPPAGGLFQHPAKRRGAVWYRQAIDDGIFCRRGCGPEPPPPGSPVRASGSRFVRVR
jgi:hypothetical protein